MTETPDRAHLLLAEVTRSVERVSSLLLLAESVQWDRGRTIRRPDDPRGSGSGTISDPTGDTATDPRRWTVRLSVRQADKALLVAVTALQGTEAALERAVAAWAGGPVDESEGASHE